MPKREPILTTEEAEMVAKTTATTRDYVHKIMRGQRNDQSRLARKVRKVAEVIINERKLNNERLRTALEEVIESEAA